MSDYRTVANIAGHIERGELLTFSHGDLAVGHISFLDRDNHIVLHVKRETCGGYVIARVDRGIFGDEWVTLAKVQPRTAASAISFDIGYPTIVSAGESATRIYLPYDRIRKVVGEGDWSTWRREFSFERAIPDVPGRTIDLASFTAASGRPEVRTIVDVGMNDARDTEYYLKKGFNVIAIEANPSLASDAVRYFHREIAAKVLTILNVGVFDTDGNREFFVNQLNPEWSSFFPSLGAREGSYEAVLVKTVSPKSLLDACGTPYYLKIDVEGVDKILLKEIALRPVKPRFVSFECGDESCLEDARLLYDAGYRRFAFVDQSLTPSQHLPPVQKEGLSVEHVFDWGCSGPFGDDLFSDWVDFGALEARVIDGWRSLRTNGGHNWFDIHARVD